MKIQTKEDAFKIINEKFDYRDEANALVHECLRAGFIEDLHAGKNSTILKDHTYSRITNEEMKKLMIETSAKLAEMLEMKDRHPEQYHKMIKSIKLMFTYKWNKELKEYSLKEET